MCACVYSIACWVMQDVSASFEPPLQIKCHAPSPSKSSEAGAQLKSTSQKPDSNQTQFLPAS